jgi:hypothetical protein
MSVTVVDGAGNYLTSNKIEWSGTQNLPDQSWDKENDHAHP